MRDILFRGKRMDNGEWAEGFYVAIGDEFHYILTGKLDLTRGYPRFVHHLVDPDTVGQHTGLTDKNGVKIFEGDIIGYNGGKEVVYFDISLNIPCFTTGIGGGSSTGPHPYKISKRHTVIGNIHDNPELLEAHHE